MISAVVGTLTACTTSTAGIPDEFDEQIVAEVVPGEELNSDCREFPSPRNVRELDELSTTFAGHPGFLGGDAAISIRLGDGRHLAVFGDTLRDSSYPGGPFARNSMMIFTDDLACVVTGSSGREVFLDRIDGVGYWPMSVSVRSSSGIDDVVIMLQRIARTANDDLGFVVLGTSLARVHIRHDATPRLVSIDDLQVDDPSQSLLRWGAALWRGSDEWIYIFGTRNPRQPGIFGWSLHVARATWGDLRKPDRWQVWDGRQWAASSARPATLIEAEGGVASVLSVFSRDDRWFAVSTKDGDLGDEIVVWESVAATGPYSPHEASRALPPDRLDGMVTYLTIAHPDLFVEPDSVVVSYSRGSADWDALNAQPLAYRPRFVRIPLPQ